jgi:hypothetical protein
VDVELFIINIEFMVMVILNFKQQMAVINNYTYFIEFLPYFKDFMKLKIVFMVLFIIMDLFIIDVIHLMA